MDLKKNKPLYQQVATEIEFDILQGKYQPGEQLPTETELCDCFSVSKITIRQAVQILVKKNLVKKVRGKGTFVLSIKETMPLGKNSIGFNDFLTSKGHKITSKILKIDVAISDSKIADNLKLSRKTPITLISRLMLEDKIPIGVDNIYVETDRFPNLPENLSKHDSFYEMIKQKYKVNINRSNLKINGIVADLSLSDLLECTLGDPLFVLDKTSFVNDDVIHFSKSFVRCDRVEYTISM